MILVKRAGILGDWIEQSPECRPRFSVHRMRVRSGNHVRACSVYLRVNCKRCAIYRMFALDNFATMVHQNQVRCADLTEMHPERIHPEMVWSFRIASRNVTGYSFIESETRKQAKCSGKHALAVQAFLGRRGKFRRLRNVRYACGRA